MIEPLERAEQRAAERDAVEHRAGGIAEHQTQAEDQERERLELMMPRRVATPSRGAAGGGGLADLRQRTGMESIAPLPQQPGDGQRHHHPGSMAPGVDRLAE